MDKAPNFGIASLTQSTRPKADAEATVRESIDRY